MGVVHVAGRCLELRYRVTCTHGYYLSIGVIFFLLCSNVNRRLSRIARGEGFGIQQRRLEAKSAVDVEIDENRLNRGKEVLRSILKVTLSIV